MSGLPKKLQSRLQKRKDADSLRKLGDYKPEHDFSSNDYLGLATSDIFNTSEITSQHQGATGSRLLTGNHRAYDTFEKTLCEFHDCQAALVFNSGYDANLGLIASLGLRGDLILFDELAHASIRDGIRLASAKALKFAHNDLTHLERLLIKHSTTAETIYVLTESVFSMDGDSPELEAMLDLCDRFNAKLIVDEAHALGVVGPKGSGLVQQLNLQKKIFARVVTFGKALGSHGAAVLTSGDLKSYLINFARPLIYTTAMPEYQLENLNLRYRWLAGNTDFEKRSKNLYRNIALLRSCCAEQNLEEHFVTSESAIHSFVFAGNSGLKKIANQLQQAGFGVLPILAPTVPKGQERLRICLHSFNKEEAIKQLIDKLAAHKSHYVQ